MEALAVHPDIAILFIVLLVLAIAILVLGWDLVRRPRRGEKVAFVPDNSASEDHDDFETTLLAVEAEDTPPPPPEKPANRASDFVFRRNFAQSLTAPAENEPEAEPPPPTKVEFSTIQNEIRAALGQAAQSPKPNPRPAHSSAMLSWTESGRLAVLSLGDSAPEIAWPLLQAQGIHILIVPEDHPFPPPNRAIELLCLAGFDEPAITALIAKLRAKLAKGERVAFYTETGLTGPAALLAARLTGRTA